MKQTSFRHLNLFLLAALLVAAVGISSPVAPTQALVGIIVNTNSDAASGTDNQCSLREAIIAANTDTASGDTSTYPNECTAGVLGTDTINFVGNYTILLSGTELPIVTSTITINGNGAANTILQGNNSSGRIFDIANTGSLTINDLTAKKGFCLGSCATVGNSGGGIYNAGTVTINNSMITDNIASLGGGIYNTGTLTLNNTLIFKNTAGGSYGGIYNSGTLNIYNSTLTQNYGLSAFGALSNESGATATVINSTIFFNGGGTFAGGIRNKGTLNLSNTIIAGSAGGIDCVNTGAIGTDTHNLIQDGTNNCGLTNGTNGDKIGVGAMLGGIADNGGPTMTVALLHGSPALDAGDNTVCAASPINNLDQRGKTRPVIGTCDIGAFEAQVQTGPAFVVTFNGDTDDGYCTEADCSLREAINAGNTHAGADTIAFDPGLSGATITLGSALPDITTDITIDGSALASQPRVSGNNTVRVFFVSSPTAALTLKDLTIANGVGTAGAVLNLGKLAVYDSTFTGNTSISNGGAILNLANNTVVIDNSTFSNNHSTPVGSGGALASSNGSVTVTNSTFSGNSVTGGYSGGAINIYGGTLTVSNSTFTGNSTPNGLGGAIYNSATLTISNSTFSGNTSGNFAGAIDNNGGTLTLINSTFSDNTAGNFAGAIYNNSGTLTLINSTLSDNTAPSGAGLYMNGGTSTVINTIIANSIGGSDCHDNSFTLTFHHNLVEDGSCSAALSGDPKLGPLQNNGGVTKTMALLPGSPAIDAGDDTTCSDSSQTWSVNSLDQRGVARPQGAHCDIGAFENNTPALQLNTTNHDFGVQPIGFTSDPFTVTVKNIGGGPLVIGVINVSGEFAMDSGSNTCYLAPLAFDQTCSFDVTFSPLSAGPKTGSVSIPSNTGTSPDSVSLSGNGVTPLNATFASLGTYDGQVIEKTETFNNGGTANSFGGFLAVGDTGLDQQVISILHFDTSSLPDNAVLTGARIQIKQYQIAGANPLFTFGNLLVDIASPFFGLDKTLSVTDFAAAAGATNTGYFNTTPLAGNWFEASLGASAFPYLNCSGSTQFRIHFSLDDNDNMKADQFRFYSGNATAAYRPVLIVEYYIP